MNLVTLITGIVIAMAVVELLLHGMPNLKRDLFGLAIVVAWIGFTSKYYYGPDITIYAMMYDETESLSRFVHGHYMHSYEVGFVLFLTLCKALDLSFWWMTAIVSTLFFYAVFMVFRHLKDKRVLALSLILVMMPDLIYAQFRQCMAVSLFTLAVVKAERWQSQGFSKRKDKLVAIILGLVAVTMHKSALFMVVPAAMYYMIQPYKIHKNTWGVLLVILMMLVIVPTQDIIDAMIGKMGLSETTMHTTKVHLGFVKRIQTNALVYGAALVVLAQFARERERRAAAVAIASAGMIVTVAFYQYYMMANRLKSYFIIFVVYYIFREMRGAAEHKLPYVSFVRQSCEILILLFVSYKAYSFDVNSREDGGDILAASTVFELVDHDVLALQKRQMLKAERFWNSGFLKSDEQNQRSNYVAEKKKQ